jgi:hypothetical protein
MFCPSCATQSADGAKFCKSCGLNLSVISQALTGEVATADPIRDREYRRARKQISDGIQGSAIGAGLLIGAGVCYFLIPYDYVKYALSLVLALAGVVKLFKSVGHIIDAKVGPKLLDPALQPRGTGGLTQLPSAPLPPVNPRASQRISSEYVKPPTASAPSPTRPVSTGKLANPAPPAPPQPRPAGEPAPRVGTGRVNRELSTPLRKADEEDDLMSKLRN